MVAITLASKLGADARSGAEVAAFVRNGVVDAKADYGAVGDGSTNDRAALQAAIDACFGTRSAPLHATAAEQPYRYRQLYIPPGKYVITTPLNFESVNGGKIFGAGRMATEIVSTQTNGRVFVTNGFQYCRLSDMRLTTSGTGVCIDLDWDNSGTALQSNIFDNMFFSSGAYGARIAHSGYMGSENSFFNCFFAGHSVAGLATEAFNALQNLVIGGNFQGCGTGVLVTSGSVPVIIDVGFQQQTNWDLDASTGGAGDVVGIHGCRTESVNFAKTAFSQSLLITGCTQLNATAGTFAEGGGGASIDSCVSQNGKLILTGGDVRNSQFGRTDWITASTRKVNVSHVATGGTLSGGGAGSPTWLERGSVSGTTYTAG